MTQNDSTRSSQQPGTTAPAGDDAVHSTPELHPTDPFEQFVAAQTQGIHILGRIWDRKLTKEQLYVHGFDRANAGRLIAAAETFWKPVRHRRVQANTRDLVAEKKLPLDALIGISSQYRQLAEHPRLTPAKELYKLIDAAKGTVPEMIATAKETVKNLNKRTQDLLDEEARAKGETPTAPNPTLATDTETDARGMRSTRFRGTEHQNSAIDSAVYPRARQLMRENPDLTLEEAKGLAALQAFASLNSSGDAADIDQLKNGAPLLPAVVLSIDNYVSLTYDDTGEAIFGLTDGTTITGTQIVRQRLADLRRFHIMNRSGQTLAVLSTQPRKVDPKLTGIERDQALEATIRPMPGQLNYGHDRRTVSDQQRVAIEAATLTCAWPGCNSAAIKAEGHHLVAWNDGGPTDLDNLTVLCKYHNGLNDDDRSRRKNGYVFFKDWEIYYQPPDLDDQPIPPQGPLAKLTSVAIAKNSTPVNLDELNKRRQSTQPGDQPKLPDPPETPDTTDPQEPADEATDRSSKDRSTTESDPTAEDNPERPPG